MTLPRAVSTDRPSRRLRAPLTTTAGVITVLALAGCTSPAPTPAAPDSAAPVPAQTEAAPEESATPAAPVGATDATCENIIPAATADDFTSLGWTSQEEPFRVGATELDDGIQCKWGDTDIASDRVQIFGWAPIDETTAQAAEQELVASGWKVEQDADGTYVTENPDWLNGRGVDGYGITYFFGDGFVKLADTRQSLVLVDAPR